VEADEAQLWQRWVGERNREAREALILLHAPWARMIAKDVFLRLRWRGIEWGEFAQNATVGLIEATDRYDPSKGVEFRAYARHRVRGAVFNGLRLLQDQSSWSRNAAYADRSESLSGDDNDGDALDLFVSWTVGFGLGHLLDMASLPDPASVPSGLYTDFEQRQMQELLREAVEVLPERERVVLTMHYFQHIPFVEVAGFLQVTKGRVSQLHRQGIERLRECLREHVGEASRF